MVVPIYITATKEVEIGESLFKANPGKSMTICLNYMYGKRAGTKLHFFK
jgi:hypothetical protein